MTGTEAGAGRTLVLAGLALTAGAVGQLAFGGLGLLAAGLAVTGLGLSASVVNYLRDGDRYRIACSDCGTKNWAERATCRECDSQLG